MGYFLVPVFRLFRLLDDTDVKSTGRYDGYYQMPDPDPEDKLGCDWYGVPPPEED